MAVSHARIGNSARRFWTRDQKSSSVSKSFNFFCVCENKYAIDISVIDFI